MSKSHFADDRIQSLDIMVALPSIVIGVGILSFPSTLAQSTKFADGWVVVILGGLISIFFTWAVTKLGAKFPHQSFYSYASHLVSKPVASIIILLFSLNGIFLTAFEVSMIGFISHQYLFEQTPREVVSIAFFLAVIYAVAGSRSGIFRINLLFSPLIFLISFILIFFSINFMDVDHLLPLFKTGMDGYVEGTIQSALSYSGFGVLFFYIAFVCDPEKVPKRAVAGMSSVVCLYLFIYLTCIAVFGHAPTGEIRWPFIELAQSVEIPGGFFERMEAVFFTIWITAIFTTAMIGFDITILALQMIFPKRDKIVLIFILAPIIFFISLLPKNYMENHYFDIFIGYVSWLLPMIVVILFWIMYRIKGGLENGK